MRISDWSSDVCSSDRNSGRFIVTTAIGINGAEDEMTRKSRQLRNSKMVNQKTVKKDGRVIAPDYSLSGKIIQRNSRVSSRTQQVDYYFQLTIDRKSTRLNSSP